MSALDDVDEILEAHSALLGGERGAPPIENGARIGASLLRAAVVLVSAGLQSSVEQSFKAALPLTFDHFNEDELRKYWGLCDRWGNPNPANIRQLFFRIGFSDVLDGLSWQKCVNSKVVDLLDEINQIRNRVAHGQPLTVGGRVVKLTKPRVWRYRNFAVVFIQRFEPFVRDQFE